MYPTKNMIINKYTVSRTSKVIEWKFFRYHPGVIATVYNRKPELPEMLIPLPQGA
jgi:hypothetical protein